MAKSGVASSKKKVSSAKKRVLGVKSSAPKVKKRMTKVIITKEDRVLEKLLIENFISMQKIMSSLTFKFDNLSKQIEGLLSLFEDSAKSIAQKEINLELTGDVENQKEVLDKLNLLLDQNKLIAKGITLVHENSNEFSEPAVSNIVPPIQGMSQGFKTNTIPPVQSMPQGFKAKPISAEHLEPSAPLSHSNIPPSSESKPLEGEGDIPKPSFSI